MTLKMRKDARRFVGFILALFFCVVSSQAVFGQVWINGSNNLGREVNHYQGEFYYGTNIYSGPVSHIQVGATGRFYNWYGGLGALLELDGGYVQNTPDSYIVSMIYKSGNYQGSVRSPGFGPNDPHPLGTLTVAGRLNASDSNSFWGEVKTLQFSEGGIFSVYVDQTRNLANHTLTAEKVNLTNGTIMLELNWLEFTGTALDALIELATPADDGKGMVLHYKDVFGNKAEIMEGANLADFVVRLNGTDWSVYNGDFKFQWDFIPEGLYFSGWGLTIVPEPATLLMMSLGMAGALVARRRRKNKLPQ